MANDILEDFKVRLADYYRETGTQVRTWATGGSPNLIEVVTSPRPTLLYVKVSNLKDEVFWGLNHTQMDTMERSGMRWFVILLDGGSDRGYVLTESDVSQNRDRW